MRSVVSILLFIYAHLSIAQEVIVRQPVNFLALGDSYTIGQGVNQNESWPYQFKNYLKNKDVEFDEIKVIARTGWTTSNLKNAIENDNLQEKFNLVSLLIGVNNQYQRLDRQLYITEFEELLDIAISMAGDKQYVFVLSIPDYGFTPFGEANQKQISAEIDDYNQISKSITESKGVAYFDITAISRGGLINPLLVASDGLHPSGKMYKEWVELIAEGLVIDQLLTDQYGSIEKNGSINVSVDPFSKTVKFKANHPGLLETIAHLEVYSMNGQRIFSGGINTTGTLLTLPYGIYVYSVFKERQKLQNGAFIIN